MKRKFAIQGVVALALVWAAVWAVRTWATSTIPTTEKVLTYLEEHPLTPENRAAVLNRVTSDYAQLSFVQRRDLRAPEAGRAFTGFLEQLTPAEKDRFVTAVLPRGLQQFFEGFARMPENQRNRALDRSRKEIAEHMADGPAKAMLENAPPAMLNKLGKDLGAFFSSLPPDVRLQVLPLIEQMQHNVRQLRD